MSWQAGSMLVLGLGLIAGAVWYERSRPRPQVIAVVAAMAALAAAGRVLFSPIPNVAPTTDLTLLTGYALGGAPGFMVGALSALISNLWLGQGPWTPWQMFGWGLAGVVGALLAAVTGRRLGRLGLAIACGLMGFLYGALLDLSAMVTFGGEQSLERYIALSVRGLPFNIAHAAGNFAIALVAGPAIVKMLSRHRERFSHRWVRVGGAGAACLLAGLVLLTQGSQPGSSRATVASAQSSETSAPRSSFDRSSGVSWLIGNQNRDGGFGVSPGRGSDAATTGWAALALAAAGRNPAGLRAGGTGPSPIAYLRKNAGRISSIGDIERTILVLAASGLETDRFGGVALRRRLVSQVGRDGSMAGQVNLTAFYLLASAAAGHRTPERSLTWLRRSQTSSGGWGYSRGVVPDADSTGAALQALVAVGSAKGDVVTEGVRWLERNQLPSGGWGLPGRPANAQSTAWALQGLIAAGRRPNRVRTGGRSGLDYLAARQSRAGNFRYSAGSNQTPVWVSAQALTAALGKAFPIAPVAAGSPERTSNQTATGIAADSGAAVIGSEPAASSPAIAGSAEPGRAGEVSGPGAGAGAVQSGGDPETLSEAGGWLESWWWILPVALALSAAGGWFGLRVRRIIKS